MQSYLEKILVCPRCQTPIGPKSLSGKCRNCQFLYKKEGGIWHLFYTKDEETKRSQKTYDREHLKVFDGPTDGSYEVLAAIARGNRTVDIACGDGFIEEFAPETVAVEFSKNALLNAKQKGAKYLVLADAHHLPFVDNAFGVSISTGNLEQFANPQQAINEMVRVSKVQVITAHREFNIPFAPQIRKIFTLATRLKEQPIERPIKQKDLEGMIKKTGVRIIYKGLWTIPVNEGQVVKFLPEFKNIPACFFVITLKK